MKAKILVISIVTMVLVLAFGPTGQAKERVFQGSLFTPVQIFPESDVVAGLRFSLLYGRQAAVTGLDIGLVAHTTTGTSKGVQYALVGYNEGNFTGWGDAAVNITMKDFEGFQFGVVNYAHHASGFQLGLVNYAESMHGLQIGLANIIKQGGQFPFMVIANWSL